MTEKKLKKYLTYNDLAVLMDVNVRSLYNATRREGFPQKRKDGKYDVVSVCKYFISNLGKSSTLKDAAQRILARYEREGKVEKDTVHIQSTPNEPDVVVVPPPANEPDIIATDMPGFVPENPGFDNLPSETRELFGPIVSKFRMAVAYLGDEFWRSVTSQEFEYATLVMKQWGIALEQLRKAEDSVLDIGLKRGDMLPKDEVVQAFVAMASNVKTKLNIVASKLAHELVTETSAKKIKEVMLDEFTEILDNLSRNPFGVE